MAEPAPESVAAAAADVAAAPSRVHVEIIEARALKSMDWNGKSDPYVEARVVAHVGDDGAPSGKRDPSTVTSALTFLFSVRTW